MPISKLPDFPSYLGFYFLWSILGWSVFILCVVLLIFHHWIIAIGVAVVAIVLFWRHFMSIERRRRFRLRFSNSSLKKVNER